MQHVKTPGLFLALALSMSAGNAVSHEMWIEPKAYQSQTGDPIIADIKVGQEFRGLTYSYVPKDFVRFDVMAGGASVPVTGRLGDRPAITMQPLDDGLHVFAHQSTVLTTSYATLEKFSDFVTHKDFAWALDAHRDRGLPDGDFREAYTRFAKSLVAVGSGAGSDSNLGLDVEFVLLENPYADATGDGIDVQLFRFGEVWADQQVEVFEKPSGADKADRVFMTRTDAEGRATIMVKPDHAYLIDAVHLREPSGELAAETKSVWETLWASTTFFVPPSR